MTNSHKSQSKKLAAGGGRETAAKKLQNRGSQAHTTSGTRARGRGEPGQRPRPDTGPVHGIALPGSGEATDGVKIMSWLIIIINNNNTKLELKYNCIVAFLGTET